MAAFAGGSPLALSLLLAVVAWLLLQRSVRGARRLTPPPRGHAPAFLTFSALRPRIRTGDLLLTRTHHPLSAVHCLALASPVSHAAIAVVEGEGQPHARVYMFEASALRGAQLREFEDYARNNGVDAVWWRAAGLERDAVLTAIERRGATPYDWSFLRDLPLAWAGLDVRATGGRSAARSAMSCGDLVARVYADLGLLRLHDLPPTVFPRAFTDDDALPWVLPLAPALRVQFDDLRQVEAARVASALVASG